MTGLIAVALALGGWGDDGDAGLVIRVDDENKPARIGPWNVKADPTPRAALRAFGTDHKTSKRPPELCVYRWAPLGLTVNFVELGAGELCSPTDNRAGSAVIRGRQWRTWRGLRVGMRERSIKQRHPRARKAKRGEWWIATATTLIGEKTRYGSVIARTSNGRVRAFDLFIGAGGD